MRQHAFPAPRLLAVVVPVCLAGLGVTCVAIVSFSISPHKTTTLLGLAALVTASTLADRFPVPVEGVGPPGVSLSFVFGVASIVLFGWAAGLLVVVLAPAVTQLLEHRPQIRIGYNVSVVALAATAAGALSGLKQSQVRHLLSYAAQQASGVSCWMRDPEHVEKGFDFGSLGLLDGASLAARVTAPTAAAVAADAPQGVEISPEKPARQNRFLANAMI